MQLRSTKVFRDNIHGYIKLPIDYVKYFIDTAMFQRLRRIEQTGMRILYPSARHDRFIHSLGTYFLGNKAFESFRENVKRSYSDKQSHYWVYDDENENEAFWDKCGVLFEIACLLHDCGHAPFSHTLEFHYEKQRKDPGSISLKDKLKEHLGSAEFSCDFKGHGTPHEKMSALIVCTEYKNAINELIKKYSLDSVDGSNSVEFVVRMIIGCKYEKVSKISHIKNCFIELLNSKSIDVDSLDYTVRDATLAGVDSMSVDVNRLLGSLTLIETTSFVSVRLYDKELRTNIINGTLMSNGKQARLNGSCRGEFTLSGSISGFLEGSVDLEGTLKFLDESELLADEQGNNKISINGVGHSKVPAIKQSASIILCGTLANSIRIEGDTLNMNQNFNGKLLLNSDQIHFISTYVDAVLDGVFSGTILGNHSDMGGQLKCELGFHKSSLSVIQNVVIARNYEYQWIYSHHKVVYSANFLLIELLRGCIDFLLKKHGIDENADDVLAKILSWDTMINHSEKKVDYHTYILGDMEFHRLSDSDIYAIYKKCHLDCIMKGETNSALYKLLEEYFTRVYRKSLWKSFAEFHIFFSGFTSDEKNRIFKLIVKKSDYHLEDQYGYLNEEWEKKLNTLGLKNIVWVNGDSKFKSINPDNTYILFREHALTYRTISTVNETKPVIGINMFYIYYEASSSIFDTDGIKDFIRTELRKDKSH